MSHNLHMALKWAVEEICASEDLRRRFEASVSGNDRTKIIDLRAEALHLHRAFQYASIGHTKEAMIIGLYVEKYAPDDNLEGDLQICVNNKIEYTCPVKTRVELSARLEPVHTYLKKLLAGVSPLPEQALAEMAKLIKSAWGPARIDPAILASKSASLEVKRVSPKGMIFIGPFPQGQTLNCCNSGPPGLGHVCSLRNLNVTMFMLTQQEIF